MVCALGACGGDGPYPIKPCETAAECDDANACTTDTCGGDGRCHYERASADDHDACTLDLCDPSTGMVHHLAAPTDDHDACTTDSCDPTTGALGHAAVACGTGQHCDALLGCTGGATVTECYPGEPIGVLDEANGSSVSTATAIAVTTGSFCTYLDAGGLPVPSDTSGGESVLAWTPNLALSSAVLHWQSTAGPGLAHLHMRVGACNDVSKELSNCAAVEEPSVSTGPLVKGVPLYLFVDEPAGGYGTYHLAVTGTVVDDQPCDLTRPQFACSPTHVCREATPGDNDVRCWTQRCRDGVDNDGDGKIDWPFEPGCTSPSDDDELDPTPAPACSNGTDDDVDSRADYPADPGCLSAADTGEANECAAGAPFTIISTDATVAPSTAVTGFDINTCGLPNTPVHLYALEIPPGAGRVTIENYIPLGDTLIAESGTRCDFANNTGSCGVNWLFLADLTPGWHTIGVKAFYGGEVPSSGVYTQGTLVDGAGCEPSSTLWHCESLSLCDSSHVCRKPACSDGMDNDGDGKIDLADPGCLDIIDDDETDPASPPQCANGIDDDGNGLTDYPQDPGCVSAGDPQEATDVCYLGPATSSPWITHSGGQFQGDFTNVGVPLLMCGAVGPEQTFRFRMPGRGTISVSACGTTNFKPAVYEMDCKLGSLYCGSGCGGADVTFPLEREVEAEIFIDSTDGNTGTFTVTITGTIDPGEPCDPAQVMPGFLQCSSGQTCQVDAPVGYRCK